MIPDLVVKMDSFFLTKGNNQDQFMMMKFPFELNEKNTLKESNLSLEISK